MDIELKKLRCERNQLDRLARALLRTEPRLVHVKVRSHMLILHSSNARVDYNDKSAYDHTIIRIPYLGSDDDAYVPGDSLINAIRKPGKTITLPRTAKPIDFTGPPTSMKKAVKVEYQPDEFFKALEYTLSVDIVGCRYQRYRGVVFNCGEIFSTCGSSIHVQEDMPHLTEDPVLYGVHAAMSFLDALRALDSFSVRGTFVKSKRNPPGLIYFEAEDESGVEVQSYSTPYIDTDDMSEVRDSMPITPNSVGFVVHAEFLREVAKYVLGKGKNNALQVTANTMFRYVGISADDKPDVRKGELPMIRSTDNQAEVTFGVSPKLLLQTIRKTDSEVQFIIPYDNKHGLRFYKINPFYVNSAGGRFAILSPMVMGPDSEEVLALRQEQRSLSREE